MTPPHTATITLTTPLPTSMTAPGRLSPPHCSALSQNRTCSLRSTHQHGSQGFTLCSRDIARGRPKYHCSWTGRRDRRRQRRATCSCGGQVATARAEVHPHLRTEHRVRDLQPQVVAAFQGGRRLCSIKTATEYRQELACPLIPCGDEGAQVSARQGKTKREAGSNHTCCQQPSEPYTTQAAPCCVRASLYYTASGYNPSLRQHLAICAPIAGDTTARKELTAKASAAPAAAAPPQ